jgi:hypothetical protein
MAIRRILIRRDTAAAWTASNPILGSGELGGETDTGKLKLGNGSTAWNSLAYQAGVTSVNGSTGVVTGLAPIASPTFTGTVTIPAGASISGFAPLASPTFTGTVTLPANTISQSMMGDDSVGTNEIGGLAVTEGKIADGAVTSAKIADGTILNADINASAAIVATKITGWEDDQVVLSNRIFA